MSRYSFIAAVAPVVLWTSSAAATVAVPAAVARLVADCPARPHARGWPEAADVSRHAVGKTTLWIIRCETAGDDEYYAAVTRTGGAVRRVSFPGFEDGKLLADVVDPEAGRSRRLGQVQWDRRAARLIGETSAGCAAGTQYQYRWTGAAFVLSLQRARSGCGTSVWHTLYREPR